MKLLWVATKAPWPPVDGGRLVLLHTLRALAERGHDIDLVAPLDADAPRGASAAQQLEPWCRATLVPARRRPAPFDLAAAYLSGEPWTVRRHRRPAVRAAADALAAAGAFDAVIAEQLQALAQAPARAAGDSAPRILRAQNVESDLWRGAAAVGGLWAPLLRRETRRLESAEGRAVREADCTAALTRRDADRLRQLAGPGARVEVLAAPFPAMQEPAPALRGSPAVVLFASGGWEPNRDQARWFLTEVWQRVRSAGPGAELHVFGGDSIEGPGVARHPAPSDSSAAFAEGSIFVVPLRVGSGVRMKILEAWARGVAVVATPEGAAGLQIEPGRELLVAAGAAEMAAAILRLDAEPGLRSRLVKAGRDTLRRDHDPAAIAMGWETLVLSLRAR